MPNDNVVRLIQPGAFGDQLTEVLRNGARALLARAVEAEVAASCGSPEHIEMRRKAEGGRNAAVTWPEALRSAARRAEEHDATICSDRSRTGPTDHTRTGAADDASIGRGDGSAAVGCRSRRGDRSCGLLT